MLLQNVSSMVLLVVRGGVSVAVYPGQIVDADNDPRNIRLINSGLLRAVVVAKDVQAAKEPKEKGDDPVETVAGSGIAVEGETGANAGETSVAEKVVSRKGRKKK
jgi:hypothetical protein